MSTSISAERDAILQTVREFCEVEVRTATAVKVAAGNLIYIVGSPPAPE